MNEAKTLLLVALSLLTISCQSLPASSAPSATLCDFSAHLDSQYLKRFTIDAQFHSDGNSYATLTDIRCPSHGLVNLEEDAPNADRSVQRFRDSREAECRRRDPANLCLVSARINAQVVVAGDSDGKVKVMLEKISAYKFDRD